MGRETPGARRGREALWTAAMFVFSFVLVFGFVRPVVASPSVVDGPSMLPTLETGDRVLVEKLGYRFSEPERGDVVLLQREGQLLIKRVAALPGETVAVRGGTFYVNGEPLRDPSGMQGLPYSVEPTVVPPGQFYVLGDNRGNSTDSRSFGPVSKERLVGEAVVILWPLNHLGGLEAGL